MNTHLILLLAILGTLATSALGLADSPAELDEVEMDIGRELGSKGSKGSKGKGKGKGKGKHPPPPPPPPSFFPHIEPFLGLWEGIDPADGGKARRQVICNDVYDCYVIGADSYWGFCDGPLGLQYTTVKKVEDGVLFTKGTLKCFHPEKEGGVTPVLYTFDPVNKAIVESFPELEDTPPIVYHYVSAYAY